MKLSVLGPGAYAKQPYGSFAGKPSFTPPAAVAVVSVLGPGGYARRPYGSFVGKLPFVPQTAAPGGNGGTKKKKSAVPISFLPAERKGAAKPKPKVEADAIAPKLKPNPGLDTTLVPSDPAPPSLDPTLAPIAPRKLEDLSRFGITTEPPSDLADYAMAERLMAQMERDEQPIRDAIIATIHDTILATIAAIKADIESDLREEAE